MNEEKNREEVLLSIIVPVYNVEKYLKECVDSLLHQTLSQYEVILVDDGSTDSSGKICDRYASKDTRIKVVHKKNGGLSSARNAGLDVAKGRYIGFVDGDDYILPDMYERLITELELNHAEIAVCRYFTFREYKDLKKCIRRKKKYKKRVYTTEETLKHFFLRNISESVCDKVYVTEVWKKCRFVEGEINEDTNVVYGMLKCSSKTVCLDSKMYGYRQRKGGITKSGYSAKFKVVEKHLEELENSATSEYPQLAKYVKQFLSIHYYCLLNAIRHSEEPWKYEKEYYQYRMRFQENFSYFLKRKQFSLKDCIIAMMLVSPFDIIGKRISKNERKSR